MSEHEELIKMAEYENNVDFYGMSASTGEVLIEAFRASEIEITRLRADLAVAVGALEAIVEQGTVIENRRIGDAWSDYGWHEISAISEEARLARVALSKLKGGA